MNKLEQIINRCKGSVTLECNEHRSAYQTVEENLRSLSIGNLTPELLKAMTDKDTCFILQFYPNTPVGYYRIAHYSLDRLLDAALYILDNPS